MRHLEPLVLVWQIGAVTWRPPEPILYQRFSVGTTEIFLVFLRHFGYVVFNADRIARMTTTPEDQAARATREDAVTERAQHHNDAMRQITTRGVIYTTTGRTCPYCNVALDADGACSPVCDGSLTVAPCRRCGEVVELGDRPEGCRDPACVGGETL